MAEVLPRHYLFGIIMCTFFVVGGVVMLSEFRNEDASFGDDDRVRQFNSTFNVMDNISTQVDSLEGSITGADTDPGIFGVLNALINSAWNSVKIFFTSFGFMTKFFGGVSTMFGIPIWVSSLVLLLITVVIVFSIISAVFQREI